MRSSPILTFSSNKSTKLKLLLLKSPLRIAPSLKTCTTDVKLSDFLLSGLVFALLCLSPSNIL